jgi:hypothetical protein
MPTEAQVPMHRPERAPPRRLGSAQDSEQVAAGLLAATGGRSFGAIEGGVLLVNCLLVAVPLICFLPFHSSYTARIYRAIRTFLR